MADVHRMSERLRISRDLHDSLGHHLTALSLHLQLALRLHDGQASKQVREAHMLTTLLLSDVREVVSDMRHERAFELQKALATLTNSTIGPRIHLNILEDLGVTDPSLAHVLVRCTQEAITNSIRHSSADNVWIEIRPENGGIAASMKDDGCGADSITPGNGLHGMRERLEELGGRLTIESKRARGFGLDIWIPLRELT